MLKSNLARISIDELRVDAYLGAHAFEQKKRRRIPVNLEYEYEPPRDDSLAAAVDYRRVRDAIFAALKDRRFCLVETMARAILDAVRAEPRICRVSISVEKTRALRQAKSVFAVVEWERTAGKKRKGLL